jgi:hypothetical protein
MTVVGVVKYAGPAVFLTIKLIAMKDMDAFGQTPSVKTINAVPALTLPSVRAKTIADGQMTPNASPVPVSPLFQTVIQEVAAYGQIMPVKMILVVIKLMSKVANLPQIVDGQMVFVQLVVFIPILHLVLIKVVAFSSLMHALMILVVT